MYSTPETGKVAEALQDDNIGETLRCYLYERKKAGKGPGDYRDFVAWAGYESMVTEDGTRLVSRKVKDHELLTLMQQVYDSVRVENLAYYRVLNRLQTQVNRMRDVVEEDWAWLRASDGDALHGQYEKEYERDCKWLADVEDILIFAKSIEGNEA